MIKLKYVSPAGDISRFKSWVNSLPQEVDSILQESANNIMREAKAHAPVKTGALRSGIIVTRIQNGYMVYASVNYSRWQEEGTSRGLKGIKFMYNAMIGEASNITGQAVTKLKFK